ncbi:S8 family peptidase [Natrinema hispanicum]|nr:S8 family peptidase [Natrinema hispanicum]
MVRTTRRNVLKYSGSGLFASLVGATTVSGAAKQPVFIHGANNSQSHAAAAAHDHGGAVVYNYENFDFVAARVPNKAIEDVRVDERVSHIQQDSVVSLATPTEIEQVKKNNGRGNSGNGGGSGGCSSQPDQRMPWGYDRIDADLVTEATGTGVNVGILDTGIQSDHCDLTVTGGTNFMKGSPNDYSDDNGHGTHVAGIIAATNNTLGTVGIAPDSTLWSVRVLDQTGSGRWSDIAAGLDWCMSNGIEIISMSIGGSYNDSVATAISEADDAGHLIICSAGNGGNNEDGSCEEENMTFPATHSSTIAVAGMDEDNQSDTFLGEYSSLGTAVDLLAPGTNVLSTYLGNDYRQMTGTSMAAPHVTGVASLVWETMGASLTNEDGDSTTAEPNDEIQDILLTSAETVLGTCEEGAGLVNAAAAIDEAVTRSN